MSFHENWANAFVESITKYNAAIRLRRHAKNKELVDFACIPGS
jgi:hypothetical protein